MLKKRKIHAIIHITAMTAGGVGSSLAQIPGSDMPILMTLQTAMITAIGTEYDCTITKANAKAILLTLPAGYGDLRLVQGKFIMHEPGHPALYIEEWAEYLNQASWFDRCCRAVNFEPGEKEEFKIWLTLLF